MSEEIWRRVEAKQARFAALSDRVWDAPELAYAEERACAEHADALAAEGFRLTRDLAGIPTAVMGEAGAGGPVIAILGEYDALPGLSQASGVAEPRPVEPGGAGHGCGHNLLGAASLLAAAAVKDQLAASGLPGRVRYLGCPAEEGGAAKGFMARDGVFSDVDVAITWHPASFCGVDPALSLANTRIDFTFLGRAAHAAASPHLGRSALDAMELMSVGVNYLREHMAPSARVHYAILDGGGRAPNVVQARAKVRYLIRAADLAELNALVGRVRKIAEGAALMTETAVETRVISAVSNLLGNAPLEAAMHENFVRLGPPPWDEADKAAAAQFQAILTEEDIATAYRRHGARFEPGAALCDQILPLGGSGGLAAGVGSTDVGDVSWVCPTVQARGATCAIGTPFHSWQLTGQGKTSYAKKGMAHVAKVMAATALDALADRDLVARARSDFEARTARTPYASPLPADARPAFDMSLEA